MLFSIITLYYLHYSHALPPIQYVNFFCCAQLILTGKCFYNRHFGTLVLSNVMHHKEPHTITQFMLELAEDHRQSWHSKHGALHD